MRYCTAVAGAITLVTLGCASGKETPPQWEYKVVSVYAEGKDRTGDGAAAFASITPAEEELNLLGLDGWELVSSYLEMETAFPNFGNEGYVTGLQPNVRPQRVVILFKRPLVAAEGSE